MVVNFGSLAPKKNLPFRFFNFWALNPNFSTIVSQAWQMEVHGSRMFRLVQKLRALKQPLKQMNKKEFSAISRRVAAAREDLSLCQRNLDSNPSNDVLRLREKELSQKFTELLLAEEMFFKQKSQVHWLKERDQNTTFFMKNFNSKANRRKVRSITDLNGNQIQGQDLKNELLNHFQSILGQCNFSYPGMDSFSEVITKTVPLNLLPSLTAIPTDQEIQDCIISFHPYKSPSLDRYNSCFFKHSWPIVGQDVTATIRDFFISGKILTEINSSYIALVPKKPNPTSANDFKPISCCSLPVMYLGLPLSSSLIKARDCQTLIEKITTRIGSWTSSFLSYAGRVVLVKSVLCSIQSFWFQAFILPKKVLEQINQLLRSFFWSGVDLKHKGTKVAWQAVCRPKCNGELGFPDLELSNRVARWTLEYLVKSKSFWALKTSCLSSGFWRKLLGLRTMARGLLRHRVGTGKDTSLWLDYWLPNGPIVQQLGLIGLEILQLDNNILVDKLISNNQWANPTTIQLHQFF
ncbi:uncharacterized protein LOC132276453 [Cornus florida]|uniref:uncharacterized protein LOC132276453 n=1 Tax=Cornus florida TaxID=4283 RepID=UPI0028996E3F|nr:uncharacterized protein LOC132276453 [Cornus florida]